MLDAARGLYEAVRPQELAARDGGASAHEAAQLGLGQLAELLVGAGIPSYDEFIWAALPAEVAGRSASTGGYPARPDPTGPLAELLASAGRLHQGLATWVGELDALAELADALVAGGTRLGESVAASEASASAFNDVVAAHDGFSPVLGWITLWAEMVAEVGTMLQGLAGRLAELRTSVAQTRFGIALAALQSETVGQGAPPAGGRRRHAQPGRRRRTGGAGRAVPGRPAPGDRAGAGGAGRDRWARRLGLTHGPPLALGLNECQSVARVVVGTRHLSLPAPAAPATTPGRRTSNETEGPQPEGPTRRKGTIVAVTIKPLEDRVLVQPLEAETTTASGLVIPDTAKEKPQEGKVVATGPGRVDDNGKRIPLDVAEGDVVIFSKYGGTEVKYDGQEYLLLNARDILAVVSK